jgi:hypothetical protein
LADRAAFCSACGTSMEPERSAALEPSREPQYNIVGAAMNPAQQEPAVRIEHPPNRKGNVFYEIGHAVGKHPFISVLVIIVLCLLVSYSPTPTQQAATGRSVAASRVNSDWRVVSVESRLIDSSDVVSKYSWRITIQNDSSELCGFQGEIEFLDADGFVVDRSPAADNSRPDALFTKRDGFVQNEIFRLLVPPKSSRTFSGTAYVAAAAAAKVSKTTAVIHKESENELPAEN